MGEVCCAHALANILGDVFHIPPLVGDGDYVLDLHWRVVDYLTGNGWVNTERK